MAEVAVVGGTEGSRMLLRGLMRLHHHAVVAEGAGPESIDELRGNGANLVLLVDAELESPEWGEAIQRARSRFPALRVVLISPSRSPRVEEQARTLGVAVVVRRPFAVHELAAAVAPEPAAPPTPDPPSSSPGGPGE